MQILTKAQEWIQDSDLQPTTLERYVYSLGLFASAGIRTVAQITRESIRRFQIARRASGTAASTVNHDLAAISSFVGWLEAQDMFDMAILHKLREMYLPIEPPEDPDWLLPADYRRLRVACGEVNPTLELAFTIAVHTGLRLGELRQLEHEDLDLESALPFVRVKRTKRRRNKRKRSRTAPIARAFADTLLSRGFAGKRGPIFPARSCNGRELRQPYVTVMTFQRWLWDARERAGLDVNWITFRHTYASWLIQNEVPINLVASFLGNTVAVCQRHYAALIPGGNVLVERGFQGVS